MLDHLSVLLLGIGLGLRHATDADHVVVVAALVQREPAAWKAARVAALWGAGHSIAFLGLGFPIVLAGIQIPQSFERVAEWLVALMLIGFGLWHLAKGRRTSESEHGVGTYARPVLIGLVHGLAGSAGIALLAASTISSRLLAAVYLGTFGLGTVLGMVLLTIVLSHPIHWTTRRDRLLERAVTIFAGTLSVLLGSTVLVRTLLGTAVP